MSCPFVGKPFDDNWKLEDPTGKTDEEYKKVIKEIEDKIIELLVHELFSSGYNCSQIVASFFLITMEWIRQLLRNRLVVLVVV